LECCADPKEANASATASSGAMEAKRVNPMRVLNNDLVQSGEAGSRRSFPACKLRRPDAAQGHALFRVQKKEPGNQLRRAWCLDACRSERVIRKRLKSCDQLFRIGI
jgi:hypothetical protein